MSIIQSRTTDQDRIRELETLVSQALISISGQQDHITALETNVAKLTHTIQQMQANPQFVVNYGTHTKPSFTTKP